MAVTPWIDTPWMAGQSCPGVGVDCVQFVVAVLDALHGYEHKPAPRLPQDLGANNPEAARQAAREILSRYPHDRVTDAVVEPGDVIVCPVGDGPGHVLLVGWTPQTAWHSLLGFCVCQVGIGGLTAYLHVWRSTEKAAWAQRFS